MPVEKSRLLPAIAFAAFLSGPAWSQDWVAKKAASEAAILTPAEEAATFVLPDGYVAELVAAEPLVEEPVLAVWDGNGVMYVAEMRSYMQDEAGTGTKTLRNGRIKRLTSAKGDGIMNAATVFADGLNLPRMILPLADGIAVAETDSTSVWHYRDTTGDGVADEKTLLFKGRDVAVTQSVEHQESGLDWNLDNWIYVSYSRERYRFTDGKWIAEGMRSMWSQWGMTHDDVGQIFYSDNSAPALGFSLPRQYWNLLEKAGHKDIRGYEPITLGVSWDPEFLSAKNLCGRDDRGGNAPARKTLTSICGQSIFRGTALPFETRGDYFFCDPTIHVVRRAKVENRNGRLFFTNPYGQDEFLNSPDILFRPVNTATGPDGCLTVVDMYRGIIQDAPWLDPGPRKFIKDSGLAAVNQHGRIWRIRHKDHTPTTMPAMNSEPTRELLRHLENPNGWWRDTAQRLIILRADRDSVAANLADMARFQENPLARLHALWTLEGMAQAGQDVVLAAMTDKDPRVRAAAVRIGEPLLAADNATVLKTAADLAETEQNPEVAKQLILSLAEVSKTDTAPICDRLIERHVAHEGVFLAACVAFWKKPTPYMKRIQSGEALAAIKDSGERALVAARWTQGFAQWDRALTLPADMPADQQKWIKSGEATFFNTCVSCHGADGMGVAVPGTDLKIAPALADSARVKGPIAGLVPVLVNGLLGPIEGQTYQGAMMVPAVALGITRDDRLAEVLSYIRFAWGNGGGPVSKEEVNALKKKYAARVEPWTDETLKQEAAKP